MGATSISLPSGPILNLFTGERLNGGTTLLASLFGSFPVALLERQ